MNTKRPQSLLIFFLAVFILLLANSCNRENDTWEDYMIHESINKIKAVTTFPTGEIIVLGYVIRDNKGGPSLSLVKYLENGLVDSVFGDEGIVFTPKQLGSFESLVCRITITNDGKILYSASITPERDIAESYIARYSADGNIDNSFGSMGIKKYSSVAIHSLELTGNNNILISGAKSFEAQSRNSFFVSLLDQNGQEIADFGSDGMASFDFNSFNTTCTYQMIQQDGKIVLLGNTAENQSIVPMLRLHLDGSLDTTFSGDGKLLADMGYDIDRNLCINNTGDDKYLSLGLIDFDDLLFARINQNGSLDSDFGQEGIAVNMCCPDNTFAARSVFVQQNGNFLILGEDKKNIVIADVLPNGELNPAFGENGIAINSFDDLYMVNDLAVIKSFGKIIVTGEMRVNNPFLDQDTDFFIMRFNEDGSVDNSFGDEGVVISDI